MPNRQEGKLYGLARVAAGRVASVGWSSWPRLILAIALVAGVESGALAQPLRPPPPPPPSSIAIAEPSAAPSASEPAVATATAAPVQPPPIATHEPAPTVSAAPPPPTAIALPEPSVAKVEPAPAPSASAAPPAEAPTGEVRLHDAVAFVIRVAHGGQTADRRAKDATKALKDAFEGASPEDVHVEILSEKDGKVSEPTAVVYIGKAPIVQLVADDAKAAGDATLAVHADSVAAQLRKAISAEKARSSLASTIFSISLVVFFGVVTLYLIRKVGEFTERANAWVEANPDRIPAIRVSRMEVLNPATLRSGLALTISVGKWFGQFGVVYAWLITTLSLFESTRGYTERLTGFIIEPFASLASRIATTLPILLVIGIALLAVAILLRVVGLFFEGVATNKTSINWLAPDLAAPTSLLIRGGIILSTLVFAAPLITGNEDGALPRAGMVTMVALGLAAVPFLASCILGAVAVFGRRVRVGEYIDLDGRVGRVADLSLLNICLEDDFGVETRIPHFAWLVRPLRILGPAPRVTVTITRRLSDATSDARARMLAAIETLGADARVEIDAVDDDRVRFALSVVTDDIDAKSLLFSLALEALASDGDEGGSSAG